MWSCACFVWLVCMIFVLFPLRFMLDKCHRNPTDWSYYAHSINTMRVDEGDKLISENKKLYFNVQVRWQGILAVKSEYVRISKLETGYHRITSVLGINASWTKRQTQDAPREIQIWIFSDKGWHQTKGIWEKSSYDFWKFTFVTTRSRTRDRRTRQTVCGSPARLTQASIT